MQRITDVNPYRQERNVERKMVSAVNESVFKRLANACLARLPKTAGGWTALLLGLILIWQIATTYTRLFPEALPKINPGQFQGVYLNNGQEYFGHLEEMNADYVLLKDVHFLRTKDEKSPQQSIDVIRMVDSVHSPENVMYIPKEQIIFWQNIRQDSPLAKAILDAQRQ